MLSSKKIMFFLSVFLYSVMLTQFSFIDVADDGAFFLRYAENMLNGEFWVWNLGEPPIWGASAPLYPLLLAIPMYLGFSPEISIFSIGIILSGLSISLLVAYSSKYLGFLPALVLLLLLTSSPNFIYYSYIGLESPLTYILIVLGTWGLISNRSWCFIGIVSGLLMIHKLDMIPVSFLLLFSFYIKNKNMFYKAFLLALSIGVIWYVFSLFYFGYPLPNSFLTKILYQNDIPKVISMDWFSSLVFLYGIRPILLFFAVLSLFDKQYRPISFFLGGLIIVHTIAYTLKYPFEPYNWYAMPSILSLCILSSIGLSVALNNRYLIKFSSFYRNVYLYLTIIYLCIMVYFSYLNFFKSVKPINAFTNAMHDWAEAGRWVDNNTPKDFRVYTMWGNPAFYSHRYVIDGSFLNRSFEENNLINSLNPEVLILGIDPGTTSNNPGFFVLSEAKNNNYKVVMTVEKFWHPGFSVLVRKDVLHLLN